MKKLIIISLSAALIYGCGNNSGNSTTDKKTDSSVTSTTTASTEDPEAKKGLELIAKSDCLTCHKLNEKLTGPAYADVAAKYKNMPGAADTLAAKIIKGGAGNWGTIPMTAHATLSKEDATSMAHYVLSIK
ncbi:MAG: hypothetical protein NVSMB45_05200 [Ginsengibacter sp.]